MKYRRMFPASIDREGGSTFVNVIGLPRDLRSITLRCLDVWILGVRDVGLVREMVRLACWDGGAGSGRGDFLFVWLWKSWDEIDSLMFRLEDWQSLKSKVIRNQLLFTHPYGPFAPSIADCFA